MIKHAQTIEQYLETNYIDNFFDYSSGVDIEADEIKKRIIELVHNVRKLGKTTSMSISSGNCIVEVFYDAIEERADISISKNHMEGHIYFEEDGILDLGGIPLKRDHKSKKWILNHTLTWED
jgi:hypothetical protein